MSAAADTSTRAPLAVEPDAPIPTWFKVGGGADRLARPATTAQLADCLRADPDLRVLGDGANLLVDDDGVGELVVALAGEFTRTEIDRRAGLVRVGAGVNLPRLINLCVREGLAGLEGLGGIPASIGGALVMNAGGAYGQIADAVARVHALDRHAREVTLERPDIGFSYRHSGLNALIITSAELRLSDADPAALREKHKEVMAYKKRTQPMAENCAGCAFKNPTLAADVEGIGAAGQRVSAGMLIDRGGCKGLTLRTAFVSDRHANFLAARDGGRARDVIELMDEVRRRVLDRFGVILENEVVVWRRAA